MRATLTRTAVIVVAVTIGLSFAPSVTAAPPVSPGQSTSASAATTTPASSATSTSGWHRRRSTSDLPAPTQTEPVSGTGTGDPSSPHPPTLVGVRVGWHHAYDRTVFDFVGGTPNYVVRYAPLVTEGQGTPVPLAGAASLLVRFQGAIPYDIDTGASTIDLTQVLNPRLPTLRQLKFGGAFEGYISAGLGLRATVGFRVFQLHSPDRVVVDVAHRGSGTHGRRWTAFQDTGGSTTVRWWPSRVVPDRGWRVTRSG
jgi:hypothetical protein